MSGATSHRSARTLPAAVPTRDPISYPSNTEDRLCSVAGSIRIAAKLLEDQPDDVMDGGLVDVLHLLQVIEKEVRAINHSAVELLEVAHG
jgi:hypothetical protein